MLEWLMANLATIVVTVIIAVAVAAILVYMYREKKKGHHSCGGNCAGCTACSHASGTEHRSEPNKNK